MPSQLPTTDSLGRKMNTFGNGTYDSVGESEYRDEGDFEPRGESLPSRRDYRADGDDMDSPDKSDVYTPVSDAGRTSSAVLPGDLDRPARSKKKPEDSVVGPGVQSVAESELPHDESNPPARSDYYDKTKVGEAMIPGQPKNDQTLDRFLGAFGNMWSGWELDDVAQTTSFPGTDRPPEEADKYTSVPTASAATSNSQRFMAAERSESNAMERFATNLDLVGTLTSDFLKKNGKKGITRRHVMAFLQEEGYHQYLASDVIRCLQQRHNVHVADVLDQFPVLSEKEAKASKTASVGFDIKVAAKLVEFRRSIASLGLSANNLDARRTLEKCDDGIMESVCELMRGLQDG